MTDDRSGGSPEPEASETPEEPILTPAELIRRAALIHAAIDEYEMQVTDEHATTKRAAERDRSA